MDKDREHLDRINAYLKDYFPHFRLEWSEDQLEKRLGTFTQYYPIYSVVTEVREVKKYPMLGIPCYILETKAQFEGSEIKNHNGWELAFPFIDVNNEPAFPDMDSVAFMMNELIPHDKKQRTTAANAEKSDEKKFDQEVEEIEERLSE